MKSIAILTLGMILSGSSFALENRGTEGHGGDPLTQLFNDARAYTAQRIENAKACSFTAGTRPEVVNWIMTRQFELANDVRQSPHTWMTDTQATCAFTQTNRMAPITFSYEACRPNIREVNDAVAILAHESAHHFGVTDEPFADEVGRAIQRLGQDCSCNPTPGTDPFDPNSCTGRDVSASELHSWIPLPNSTTKKLGDMETHVRERTCYHARLCTPWASAPNFNVSRNGSVYARFFSDRTFFYSDAPHSKKTGWSMYGTIDQSNQLQTTLVSGISEMKIVQPGEVRNKLTSTCYRGTISKSRLAKDSEGNTITIETDIVILSHFNK